MLSPTPTTPNAIIRALNHYRLERRMSVAKFAATMNYAGFPINARTLAYILTRHAARSAGRVSAKQRPHDTTLFVLRGFYQHLRDNELRREAARRKREARAAAPDVVNA